MYTHGNTIHCTTELTKQRVCSWREMREHDTVQIVRCVVLHVRTYRVAWALLGIHKSFTYRNLKK